MTQAPCRIDFWLGVIPPQGGGQTFLTAAEQARAATMHAARRSAFVAGRRLIRQVLGAALNVAAPSIRLVVEDSGRLSVPGSGLHVSLSHTAKHVALAVANQGPIGVDIEDPTRDTDWRRIGSRRLHPEEWREILRLEAVQGEPAARQRFFQLWSMKEAIVKATGDTLMPVLGKRLLRFGADGPHLETPSLALAQGWRAAPPLSLGFAGPGPRLEIVENPAPDL